MNDIPWIRILAITFLLVALLGITHAAATWTSYEIGYGSDIGRYSDCVYDTNDNLHVFHYDYSSDALKHIKGTEIDYTTTTLMSGEGYYFFQAAADSSGQVHLAVFADDNGNDGKFYYLKRSAEGSWSSPELIFDSGNDTYPDSGGVGIAVTSENEPWVITRQCWLSSGWHENVTVFYKSGEDWVGETILDNAADASGRGICAIAMDSTDTPHITYIDQTDDTFYYASRTGADSWSSNTIMTSVSASTGAVPRLFFISDTPNVIYSDSYTPYHAVYSGSWSVNAVLPTIDCAPNAMKGSDDTMWIVAGDNDMCESVKVAYKTTAGSWSDYEEISDFGSWYTSGAVDSSDNPTVIFADDGENHIYAIYRTLGDVSVGGITYCATNATPLENVTVACLQNGTYTNTTSNATGNYLLEGLWENLEINITGILEGYTGGYVEFTPPTGGQLYSVDIPLIPDEYNTSSTTIGGIVYLSPYYDVQAGCTVTISNATWENTTSTNNAGYYEFCNLTASSTYDFTASYTDHQPDESECNAGEEGSFTQHDILLQESFTLTVYAKELESGGVITGDTVTISLDTGQETTTTTGSCTFEGLDYGCYTITGSCMGYYPGSSSIVVDESKSATVYLDPVTEKEAGPGGAYAPKTVLITVQTIWGSPIEDCCVNCTGYETTAGSWDWLYQLFGVDVNETPIATATMSGYTDYKGDIDFVMFEPVKYNCTFYKVGEIDKYEKIYPKYEHYIILATEFGNSSWLEGGIDINQAINITVTTSVINSTAAYINMSYADASGGTTGGTCWLNQTDPADRMGDELVIDSDAITGNSCSCSFIVTDYAGESYVVRVKPTHDTWDFERDFAVTFPEEEFNPLGLTDFELMLIAAFLILFTGCLFGAISAPHAPLIMCFMAWIMYVLGFLNLMRGDTVAELKLLGAMTLATVLSVLMLVMVRSKKERFV